MKGSRPVAQPAAAEESVVHFDPLGPLPGHRTAIEASAGTGKTHALATLATRFVAEGGVAASELLVVTFTRAAANDLRAKVRQRLVTTAQLLETGATDGSDVGELAAYLARDDLTGRIQRLRRAVTEFDAATVTTIHGFAFQVRAALGAGSGAEAHDRLLPDHLPLLRAACTDVVANASATGTESDALPKLDTLVRVADQIDGRPDLVVYPGSDDPAMPTDLRVLSQLLAEATELARDRRRLAGALNFDDILVRFRTVLRDARIGQSAARQLASRYRVVLIDEFQDTDPVQWDIFSALFGDGGTDVSLVLVGDPKQSIYGFRGADVHTYRRAVADPRTVRRVLATNWRSDEALLDAVGALLTGATFGEGIDFHAVNAAADHRSGRVRDTQGRPLPALALRVAVGPGIKRRQGDARVTVPGAKAAILDDLTSSVRDLLGSATLPAADGSPGRLVRPGDVAVLVPRHQDAVDVQSALRAARIPAVVTRAGSVLESEAADQLRWLLHAMERPSDLARVRLAALSWFGGWSADDVAHAGADDPAGTLVLLQERLRSWADLLAEEPVAAALARVRAESGVLPRLLAQPDGDRHVTDLDHLAELLGATVRSGRGGPATLLDLLDDVPDPAVEGDAIVDVDSDPRARRLESDAEAVQIMTTWMAKGLEFPIVALPMAWWEFSFIDPDEYVEPATGARTVDLTVDVKHPDFPDTDTAENRRVLIHREADGEHLRLLYVALTRAQHLNLVWWAHADKSACSALAHVLFARHEGVIDPERFARHQVTVPDHDEIIDFLAPLAEVGGRRHPGALHVESVDATDDVAPWTGGDEVADEVELRIAEVPSPDRRYQRWSFSRIVDRVAVDRADPGDESLADAGASDEPGLDEDALADALDRDLAGQGSDPSPVPGQVGPAADGVNPMAGLAGGTAFGTLVHTVLERVDWQSEDIEGALAAELDDCLARRPLELVELPTPRGDVATPESGRAALLGGLVTALRAPLGPQFAHRRLTEVVRGDRLAELAFDMLLGAAGGLPTTRDIGETVRHGLRTDDPFLPWAESLSAADHDLALAGNLTGSIDLVVRVPGPSGTPRFVIADYKTNALHPPGLPPTSADYAVGRLVDAMVEHDYPLQALLYSVALHRYLRWRLPGYDPTQHLGGAAYLFLRGMDGSVDEQGVPRGVLAWSVPPQLVVDLSELLDGASRGAAA